MNSFRARFRTHLSRNALGYVALAIALSGTAYAATKLGPNDIAKNAIRSKHIAAKQVKLPDVNRRSLGKALGAGTLGGEVEDFGAGGGVGLQAAIAPIGEGRGTDSWRFVAPKKMRARDLFVRRGAGPVPAGREVTLAIRRNLGEPDFKELLCRIPAGSSTCGSKGRLLFRRGDELSAQLRTPSSATALPESLFLFGYRLVP
jgi:hypothetical protein